MEIIQKKLDVFQAETKVIRKITKEYDDYKKKLIEKIRKGQEPTKQELKEYIGLGNQVKHKLSIHLGCLPKDIALSVRDFQFHAPMYVYGNVTVTEAKQRHFDDIYLKNPKKLRNVKKVFGDLTYESPINTTYLGNLTEVVGDLHIIKAQDLHGLSKFHICRGNLTIESAKSLEGLDHLKEIWGSFTAPKVRNEAGLKELEFVLGDWNPDFTSARLPELRLIGGTANFSEVKNQHLLPGLQYIGGDAHFESACSRYSLQNLEYIGGDAYFNNLARLDSLDNLTRDNIGGEVYMTRAQEEDIVELLEKFEVERINKQSRNRR